MPKISFFLTIYITERMNRGTGVQKANNERKQQKKGQKQKKLKMHNFHHKVHFTKETKIWR